MLGQFERVYLIAEAKVRLPHIWLGKASFVPSAPFDPAVQPLYPSRLDCTNAQECGRPDPLRIN